jgi:Domain of unknown function (DUF4037)
MWRMPTFVPGLELNASFYRSVVAPLVSDVAHAAALLGPGSDVLGYDTARSTDHGWGPHLQLFVSPSDVAGVSERLSALPETFEGWPVRYGWDDVAEQHHLGVTPLSSFLAAQLGVDPRPAPSARDWLLMPQQQLLGVVRGAVYFDPAGELAAVRSSLAYFPEPVWLWMLGCQWGRIGQEEAFVGRCAEVGDELGSQVVAARLARELMRLAFLLERTYWPYTKWFGTAFASLSVAGELGPLLSSAVAATAYPAREAALVSAYELLAQRHNALEVTKPVDPSTRQFHGRPFRVLMAERFAEATIDAVSDPWLRSLPPVGSVDQFVDSTDVLSSAERARALDGLYVR